eukprot:TRINITY_DN7832_c0_g1_i1.p1 TRINITY_DN7832_c0_g1~~TRINITY_DN7832_c0_g1_i1.p1  ORF type:complete len:414 (+),score=95.98 TRINITY_DN7832_c0_g1_i1:80-1321(+)
MRVVAALLAAAGAEATRVAFGSCNRVGDENNLLGYSEAPWERISARAPDAWVWTGDIVYADVRSSNPFKMLTGKHFSPAPPGRAKGMYDALKRNPAYKALAARTRVLGVWDDHDFGLNDGGRNHPHRVSSQQELLDFLDEPQDSPRRKQEGVYASAVVGKGETAVRVVLLDNRFHKDPYGTPDGDFLGAEQWEWLERELSHDGGAGMTLVVSGIQVLEWRAVGESWGRFPRSRARLLNLVARFNARGGLAVLVSGDVHFAEIAEAVCTSGSSDTTVAEITASGLTHSWGEHPFVVRQMFRLAMGMGIFRYRTEPPYALRNWGELQFNGTHAELEVFGARDGAVALRYVVPKRTAADAESWVCAPHGGEVSQARVVASWCVIFAPIASVLAAVILVPVYVARRCCCGGKKRKEE